MKGSIYTKIKNRTLLMAIAAVAAIAVIMVVGLLIIRQSTINASNALGDSAAADAKQALSNQTGNFMLRLSMNKAELFDEKLLAISDYAEHMSTAATALLKDPSLSERESLDLLKALVLTKSTVSARSETTTVYYGTKQGELLIEDTQGAVSVKSFDPDTSAWYTEAKEANALIWTDVFDDEGRGGLTISCATPYYGADGEIAGVAGVDVLFSELGDAVLGDQAGESSRYFIVSRKGQLIVSDSSGQGADGTAFREGILESGDEAVLNAAKRIVGGEAGVEHLIVQGVPRFIAFYPLETIPWSIAAALDLEYVIAPALKSERGIIELKQAALSRIDRIIIFIALAAGIAILLVVLSILPASSRLAKGVTKPILSLTEGAVRIGGGDLSHVLDVKTGDELETLSDTFNAMIRSIKSITADKERIGAELSVATRIQASMLPCIFPPFPERDEFDIFASMLPAKEVGGDFYDFFLVDENTLAVVMADVSGKGVPAALFMVIAKTLIKNNAQYGKMPQEVFETVNDLLCENNEANMFVTAFLGYLDIASGIFTYVNAGHNVPLIKRAGGEFDWLAMDSGFVLGGLEGLSYQQEEIRLGTGDTIFLYTDGVTEAVNPDDELFSDVKLLETLNANPDCSLSQLLPAVKREIDAFADGAEQADDITMLALTFLGRKL